MAVSNASFAAQRAQVLGLNKPGTASGGAAGSQPRQTTTTTLPNSFQQQRSQVFATPYRAPAQTPVQITTPPVQQGPSVLQRAGNAVKSLGKVDLKKIGQAFFAGVKQVPGQVQQAGGIVTQTFINQQKSVNNFFKNNPAAERQVILSGPTASIPGIPLVAAGMKVAREVPIINKAVSKVVGKADVASEALRERGFQSQKRQIEEYQRTATPSEGIQKYAELVAMNLPQMAVSTGLTLATAAITKNPQAATAVGLSTSYGLGASEVYNQARSFGVSDSQAVPLAQIGGAIIGAIDFLPISNLLDKVGATDVVKKSLMRNIAEQIVSTGLQAGLEGVTETAQEMVGNALARTYDENASLFQGTKDAFITAVLSGGLADVTVSGVMGVAGKNASPEQVVENVQKNIQTALETDPQQRTPEQTQLVKSMLTQELTPDQAMSYVINNNIEQTPEGKEIIKLVAEAKNDGNVILIEPDDQNTGIQARVVPPGTMEKESSTKIFEQNRQSLLDTPSLPSSPPSTIQGEMSTKGTQEQGTESTQEKEIAKRQEITDYYRNADQQQLEDALGGIWMEMNGAQAGERIFNDRGEFIASSPSTFPKWVPEELRRKDLFDSVLSGFSDPTNIQYPPNSQPRKQELYEAILDEIDLRSGLNSADIRLQLREIYEQSKTAQSDQPAATTEIKEESSVSPTRSAPGGERTSEKVSKEKVAPQETISTTQGKEKFSRAYTRVRDRIDEQFRLDPTYTSLNIQEESQKAIEFAKKEKDRAVNIAKGLEAPPAGYAETAISIAAAEQALADGDMKLYSQLEAARSLRQTRRGQEIVLERGRMNEDGAHHYVQEVLKARLEQVAKKVGFAQNITDEVAGRVGGKSKSKAAQAVEYIDQKAEALKNKVTKETLAKLESAETFLDKLTCKI